MPYIVQSAPSRGAAPSGGGPTRRSRTPSSCWGRYGRVAVLEVEHGVRSASMISARARGVRRVVRTWERCYIGLTPRCAFERAVTAAERLAAELNAREERNARRRARRAARRAAPAVSRFARSVALARYEHALDALDWDSDFRASVLVALRRNAADFTARVTRDGRLA